MKDGTKSTRWVYNSLTGSILRKTVKFRINEMEEWFEDSSYHSYFPEETDESKEVLIGRVNDWLAHDLQNTLDEASSIMDKIRKVLAHGEKKKV